MIQVLLTRYVFCERSTVGLVRDVPDFVRGVPDFVRDVPDFESKVSRWTTSILQHPKH